MEELRFLPNGQWELRKAESHPFSFKHTKYHGDGIHEYELMHEGKPYGSFAVDTRHGQNGETAGEWSSGNYPAEVPQQLKLQTKIYENSRRAPTIFTHKAWPSILQAMQNDAIKRGKPQLDN